jgi:hypothetical protein
VENTEKKHFIDELKGEWKSMWRNRLDDKVRAEGIADKDYVLLSVERGTVIIATRKFRLLDFGELIRYCALTGSHAGVPPDPSVGGWGKFIRTSLPAQSFKRQRRQAAPMPYRNVSQQLKKGGRGWLHAKR